MRLIAFLLAMLSCHASLATDVDARAKAEIAYLFDQMQQSGCQFARNGSWYSADDAVQHIDRKYQYLLKRSKIRSTEMFIELAASKSSTSGQPYRVKCGESAAVDSAEWFQAKLGILRSRNE